MQTNPAVEQNKNPWIKLFDFLCDGIGRSDGATLRVSQRS